MADQKDKVQEKSNQEKSGNSDPRSGGNMGAGKSGKEGLGSEKPSDEERMGSHKPGDS